MGLDMFLRNSKDEQVAYWRKANQIRGWLVSSGIIEEDDNCTPRVVKKEELKLLVEDCKKVLENHELAEEVMPPTSGFFFGSAELDEWYYKDLEQTVKMLEPLLQEEDEYYVYSDWW